MGLYQKVVCFDLFHTLVLPIAGSGASYADILVKLGAPREQIYPIVRNQLMITDKSIEEMVQHLFETFGISLEKNEKDYADAVAGWKADNQCKWMDGALELIEQLRSDPTTAVCLISNVTRPAWEMVNHQLLLADRFDAMHLSWQHGVAKPDIYCWKQILQQLGMDTVSPDACWMIGDNQTDDLDPPASMGWKTILIKPESGLRDVQKRVKQ